MQILKKKDQRMEFSRVLRRINKIRMVVKAWQARKVGIKVMKDKVK